MTSSYKDPEKSKRQKTYKGRYTPKNPEKYRGKLKNIVYRSGWELYMMNKIDNNPDVVAWSSEETPIHYRHPVTGNITRYWPDFWIKAKTGQEIIVEIKPYNQCIAPDKASKKTAAFKMKVATYLINQAKFSAAKKYCKERGMKFQVLTEHELGIK